MFPPAADLWAWAHVHLNQTVAGAPGELVSTDMGAVLAGSQAALAANRDLAYSRLLCPRRLADNTAYHAFVIPTFETGRLAGLGHDPAAAPVRHRLGLGRLTPASRADLEFPIYYRWHFRTGDARRLRVPGPPAASRSRSTRSVGHARHGRARTRAPTCPASPPRWAACCGSAERCRYRTPTSTPTELARAADGSRTGTSPTPTPFQTALAAFIEPARRLRGAERRRRQRRHGLAAGIDDDPDPLITAPLYGRWHALTQRLLTERDGTPAPNHGNWVHRLNLDPRFRVPAGFGATVVETNAEEYMNDAWQQIGDVLAANTRIRRLHLAVARRQRAGTTAI